MTDSQRRLLSGNKSVHPAVPGREENLPVTAMSGR